MSCSFLDIIGVLLRLATIGVCSIPVGLVFGWDGVLFMVVVGVVIGVVQTTTAKPKG